MTKNKRYCKDCKYCRGIGYDFWCGEGHTEYEVFLGETNCPYYEFHDWSKGTPNRTKNKRFEEQNPEYHLNKIYDNKNGKVIFDEDILDLLNDLNDENEQLKEENKQLKEESEDLNEELMECDSFVLLYKERRDKLKKANNDLIHLLENQSIIICELHSKLMHYQLEEPIVLTKEDLEIMGKAISYYTHEGE